MCTLTWRREATGTFEVFFNRDEKKTRSRAEPPREFTNPDGLRFLSPIDPDAGGTWMLANAMGVVVCLLNRWHESHMEVADPVYSRGRLVSGMAPMENVPAVEEQLRRRDLSHCRPFTMVAFDAVGERGFEWNGRELRRMELAMPLTSSSFHYEEVMEARRDRYEEVVDGNGGTRKQLWRFHSEARGAPSAYTVRMCRPDAQTMSRSIVRVDARRVDWNYLEEPAELLGEPEVLRVGLER
jgi:hypothetical protein